MGTQWMEFEWWGMLDAGVLLNYEIGVPIYSPSELYQAHFMIGPHEVWVEWNRLTGLYRLQVGRKPNSAADTIDRREYERRILWLQQDARRKGVQ